ncbi:MAG: hypothetical protein HY606_12580 [Planctomycetes bacterium]|nr:hypothetical protein [Planctomycetota bacterium]
MKLTKKDAVVGDYVKLQHLTIHSGVEDKTLNIARLIWAKSTGLKDILAQKLQDRQREIFHQLIGISF